MNEDAKYDRIWKSMEHCVNVCILSTFRSAREILSGWNWAVVHERCVQIIQKHMKELNIRDPHEFDKAVCWYAVKSGKDRDPLWRCICSFFFAAAMQLDKVQRMERDSFKKIKNPDIPNMSRDDLIQILKELKESHGDMHGKLDEMRGRLIHSVNQTQVSQVNNVTNHHHAPTGQIGRINPTNPMNPTQSLADFLKDLLGDTKDTKDTNGGDGSYANTYRKNTYAPRGWSDDRAVTTNSP